MTTAVLKTFVPGGLYDHDIQTLKDFAIEAPYEWRCALQELISTYEIADKAVEEKKVAEELAKEKVEELKTLEEAFKAQQGQMLKLVEKLESGRRNGNLTKGDIDIITTGMRNAFEKMRDATG